MAHAFGSRQDRLGQRPRFDRETHHGGRAIWNIGMITVLEHVYQMAEHIVEVVVKWAHLINLGVWVYLRPCKTTIEPQHFLILCTDDGWVVKVPCRFVVPSSG
jgi:hypothetical protein